MDRRLSRRSRSRRRARRGRAQRLARDLAARARRRSVPARRRLRRSDADRRRAVDAARAAPARARAAAWTASASWCSGRSPTTRRSRAIVQQGRATAAPELGYSVHVDVDGPRAGPLVLLPLHAPAARRAPSAALRTAPAAGARDAAALRVRVVPALRAGLLHRVPAHGARGARPRRAPRRLHLRVRPASETRVRRRTRGSSRDARRLPAALRAVQERPRCCRRRTRAARGSSPGTTTRSTTTTPALVGENDMESEEQMRTRRAAAYQAWWEHQPVRVPRARSWADLTHHAHASTGARSRASALLDTRQYRSRPGVRRRRRVRALRRLGGPGAHDARRRAGALARRRARRRRTARWQVLAQSGDARAVRRRRRARPSARSMDKWSGYPAARDAAAAARSPSARRNRTVVITGDIHSNWVNELRADFRGGRTAGGRRGVRGDEHHLGRRRRATAGPRDGRRRGREPARAMAQRAARLRVLHGDAGHVAARSIASFRS